MLQYSNIIEIFDHTFILILSFLFSISKVLFMNKLFSNNFIKILTQFYVKIRYPFYNIKISDSFCFFSKLISSRINTINILGGKIIKSHLKIIGRNNTIMIRGEINKCNIEIHGNNNNVRFLKDTKFAGCFIFIKGDNLDFIIERSTSSTNGTFILMGDHNYIKIGKDCMLADKADIWATDSHPIYNFLDSSIPINPSEPIEIGDHVWVGKDSAILKGVKIGNNSIIGMKSVVTKHIPDNCIFAGNPAKKIKDSISWDRKHIWI